MALSSVESIAWLNGAFLPLSDAKISPLDRGFLFADSVYEVVPYFFGQFFLLEEHLQRLMRSSQEIGLPLPYTPLEWIEIFNELVLKNPGHQHLALYCQVSRGVAAKEVASKRLHTYRSQTYQPTLFIMVQPLKKPEYTQSYSALIEADIRWHRADIKSTSLLPNVMLKQLAEDQGAEEVILHRDGWVTEGSSSNVFAVLGDSIVTPPKSPHILGGITRDIVVSYADRLHLKLSEHPLSLEALKNADEIWMTSSTKGLLPIGLLKQTQSSSSDIVINQGKLGPVWQRLNEYFWARVAD